MSIRSPASQWRRASRRASSGVGRRAAAPPETARSSGVAARSVIVDIIDVLEDCLVNLTNYDIVQHRDGGGGESGELDGIAVAIEVADKRSVGEGVGAVLEAAGPI